MGWKKTEGGGGCFGSSHDVDHHYNGEVTIVAEKRLNLCGDRGERKNARTVN